MENIRINIETWGGHTSPEQLADTVECIVRQLSNSNLVTCTVEGIDSATASMSSTVLISDKQMKFDEVRVNKYGALTIKIHP